ncbi:MAG: hypothetical protein ACFFBV_11325 [Promethearchaeota archaeon]
MRKIEKGFYKIIEKLLKIKRIRKLFLKFNGIIENTKFIKVDEEILGFHGDQYLLNLVNFFLLESSYFIETGTRTGITLKYVAESYKHLKLFSCEPNKNYFSIATKKLKTFNSCKIYNETSQEFLPKILNREDLNKELIFFFLDAHGEGFKWPLKQEIEQITYNLTEAIILIDDFKVPNNPQFNYDVYADQECSMDFIKNKLNSARNYVFIYPKYRIKTSNYPHFPGYIIILMGLDLSLIKIPIQLFENYYIFNLINV